MPSGRPRAASGYFYAMPAPDLLNVSELSVDYYIDNQCFNALHGIDFQIGTGQTLGIAGESGSGKTTLALSLMGLLPPGTSRIRAGNARWSRPGTDPVDLLDLPPGRRGSVNGREIGMVFQEPLPALNPVFTCGSQVAEVLRRHLDMDQAGAKSHSMEIWERTGLAPNLYGRYPHQLSGGQRQRVLLAMATACNPSLLIADEPTTALDMVTQAGILELIRNLQQEYGMGVIFISHDLDVIREMADAVLVLQNGRVVESGPVREVITRPSNDYTKKLLAASEGGQRKRGTRKSAEQEPLLQVAGLRKWFQGGRGETVKAVDGVDLEIAPGETLGLAGMSGCGKTTLCCTILRLTSADAGKILFRGMETDSKPGLRRFRRHTQAVFQDPAASLNPAMRVGEALMEPMRVHRIHGHAAARKQVAMLLEQTGLDPGYANRYPREMSAGEKQRVCIARALAMEPQLVICDEPVSSLDATVRIQVLELLDSLKQQLGLSFLFISHDLQVIRQVSDRVMVMHDGRIVEAGDPAQVFSNPESTHTRQLLAALPKTVRSTLSAYSS